MNVREDAVLRESAVIGRKQTKIYRGACSAFQGSNLSIRPHCLRVVDSGITLSQESLRTLSIEGLYMPALVNSGSCELLWPMKC